VTPDEMRDAIEAQYRLRLPKGSTLQAEVPAGITPADAHYSMDFTVQNLDEDVFKEAHAAAAGEALAGLLVSAGCDTFKRSITFQDRPAAQVKSGGGALMVRKRAFIVHALGWRSN
jgi:hypothetical protein